MPFHTDVIVVLMAFMTVEIAVEIAVHTVVTVVWIVFSTEHLANSGCQVEFCRC